MKTYLVTGGAGFIGSNFVKYILKKYENIRVIIFDKLTYAGDISNIKKELEDSRTEFLKGDICSREQIEEIFMNYDVDYVINFAAESHVDRSIENPKLFLETNVIGTQVLLDVSKSSWETGSDERGYPLYKTGKKFIQISTDEVYGSLERNMPQGKKLDNTEFKIDNLQWEKIIKDREEIITFGDKFFNEETPLDPRSPYSASKAGGDMLVKAYGETYHLPVNITRCSNNYGPNQHSEKLIPLMIKKVFSGERLPIYGHGENVRDWLYVEDHCCGIDLVINGGRIGEVYNIGGYNEKRNIDIVRLIIDTIKKVAIENEKVKEKYKNKIKSDPDKISYDLITYVKDRLGHDERYAINPGKISSQLGWYPKVFFEEGIEATVRWYLEN